MKKRRSVLIKVLDGLAILMIIATFSSLIIPEGTADPYLLGVPYTMWTSFIVSIIFVILAYLVSLLNKEENHAD